MSQQKGDSKSDGSDAPSRRFPLRPYNKPKKKNKRPQRPKDKYKIRNVRHLNNHPIRILKKDGGLILRSLRALEDPDTRQELINHVDDDNVPYVVKMAERYTEAVTEALEPFTNNGTPVKSYVKNYMKKLNHLQEQVVNNVANSSKPISPKHLTPVLQIHNEVFEKITSAELEPSLPIDPWGATIDLAYLTAIDKLNFEYGSDLLREWHLER